MPLLPRCSSSSVRLFAGCSVIAIGFLAAVLLPTGSEAAGPAEAAPEVNDADEAQLNAPFKLSAAEAQFARLLSNASLIGGFTAADRTGPHDAPPAVLPERYDLGEVRKVGDNLWLIPARIRYAGRDVTLPITLPVRWAGDTAVIVVDKVGLPGLGVYSARVMVQGDRYAGFWSGAGHGGHLFGVIKPRPKPLSP